MRLREKAIHEKGGKGDRDRAVCARDYAILCRFFHVKKMKDSDIAKLSNLQFFNLCRDIFERQPMKRRQKYAEKTRGEFDVSHRLKPWAFKWFLLEMKKGIKFRKAPWWKRFGIVLVSPVLHRRALWKAEREQRRREEEARENAKATHPVIVPVKDMKLELLKKPEKGNAG